MVLGLIEFLLGGKKKSAPKRAQVGIPMNSSSGYGVPSSSVGLENTNVASSSLQGKSPINNENLEFQDSSVNSNVSSQDASVSELKHESVPVRNALNKKTVSEVLKKLSNDIKEINENIASLSSEIKDIKSDLSSLNHRVSEIESDNKVKDEKLSEIDESMNKFLSLYEVVNNQFNPFVSEDSKVPQKTIVVNSERSSSEINLTDEQKEEFKKKLDDLDKSLHKDKDSVLTDSVEEDLESSLLELDMIDLDSAAGSAVPLTHLKTSTNSLVVILSWLEYLVNKAGIEETKKTLTYYTETLKWITPEVYFELDKFLRGMDDIEESKREKLSVRDHIVSLYFISKLNEKKLDDRLTKAVLQIIKEN